MSSLTRREWMRAAARWLLVAGSVAGAGSMMSRKGSTCIRSGPCSGCPASVDCPLPKARVSRENRRGR